MNKRKRILIGMIIIIAAICIVSIVAITSIGIKNKDTKTDEKEELTLEIESYATYSTLIEDKEVDTSTLFHPNRTTKYSTYEVAEVFRSIRGYSYEDTDGKLLLAGECAWCGRSEDYIFKYVSKFQIPETNIVSSIEVEIPWGKASSETVFYLGKYRERASQSYVVTTRHYLRQDITWEGDTPSYGPIEVIGTQYVACEELSGHAYIREWTGLFFDDDPFSSEEGWLYKKNGEIDYTHTGIVYNGQGCWYVENGTVNLEYTGIVEGIIEFGEYLPQIYIPKVEQWYIENGQINFDYSGPVTCNGITYQILEGRVQDKE